MSKLMMVKARDLGFSFALLGTAALAPSAFADGPPSRPPGKPPAEAYAACDSKAVGDTCTVQFGERTMEGTCATRVSDTKLSCRPSRPPPRRR